MGKRLKVHWDSEKNKAWIGVTIRTANVKLTSKQGKGKTAYTMIHILTQSKN